jgi:hypothetical protein
MRCYWARRIRLFGIASHLPFITDFSGTVDVLDGEDTAQPVECDFGQSGNELRCRHQHVNGVGSVKHAKTKTKKYVHKIRKAN